MSLARIGGTALFLVQSFHQYVQASALSSAFDRSELVLFPTNDAGRTWIERGHAQLDDGFEQLHTLDKPTTPKGPRRWWTARANEKRLIEVVAIADPDHAFLSNIQLLEGMSFAHICRDLAGASLHLIEDGFATYERRAAPSPSRAERRRSPRYRLATGLVAHHAARRPLSPIPFEIIDSLCVWFPELVAPVAWPSVEVVSTPQGTTIDCGLGKLLAGSSGSASSSLSAHLILLPHSGLITAGEAQDWQALARTLASGEEQVAVKYHPRETNSFASLGNVAEVPRTMPAELILASASGLQTVVSQRSTALTSARRLTDATVLCVDRSVSDEFADALNGIGILRASSPESAAATLSSR